MGAIANPVLVGAVTTLVTVVAVFLAYNANNGLPFVPTRQLNVDVPSGSNLVKGNEVREGGYRIGVVTKITPVTMPSGQTVARLQLKLDKKVGKIPADTRITIRPRSALGLKYLQFERGSSHRYLQDGDTIPLDQTTVPVGHATALLRRGSGCGDCHSRQDPADHPKGGTLLQTVAGADRSGHVRQRVYGAGL